MGYTAKPCGPDVPGLIFTHGFEPLAFETRCNPGPNHRTTAPIRGQLRKLWCCLPRFREWIGAALGRFGFREGAAGIAVGDSAPAYLFYEHNGEPGYCKPLVDHWYPIPQTF